MTRARLCLLAGLLTGLCGCSASAPPPQSWLGQVAEGQLQRAREQAADGNTERARQLASDALAAARQAGRIPVMAQAQLLLGRLHADRARLEEANALFVFLDDDAGQAQAGLALAELAVQAGQTQEAIAFLEDATRRLADVGGNREEQARAEARVDHLHATALRLEGRRAEAASQERRAHLALTLLRDDELLALRLSICQSLGDDCGAAFDFRQALEHHAHAADLARRSGDRAAALIAAESLGQDLQGLGRPADAYTHCARALRLAVELQDSERISALLHRSQELLLGLGEGPGTARWNDLLATAGGAG